jgi:uncharacterized membrane protein YjfL (UPF0719 family)
MREELGDDEIFLMLISIALTAITGYRWMVALSVSSLVRSRNWLLLLVTPISCLAFVLFVLRRWADDEVRDDWRYLTLLLLLGAGWMGMFSTALHWMGLSLRQDAAERRNLAATLAWCGAMIGISVLYAGGSTGEGPSLWNNVFSAGLGTAAMIGFWFALEWMTRISHSITIDRDLASGVRIGGFMLACGIVFGRALAGDWRSADQTIDDFLREGWIVGAMVGLAAIVEAIANPRPTRPRPNWFVFGVLPAAVYLAGAVAWVKWLGPWK